MEGEGERGKGGREGGERDTDKHKINCKSYTWTLHKTLADTNVSHRLTYL